MKGGGSVTGDVFVNSVIPHHNRARAVISGRNGALEVFVIQRVILHLHRQPGLA